MHGGKFNLTTRKPFRNILLNTLKASFKLHIKICGDNCLSVIWYGFILGYKFQYLFHRVVRRHNTTDIGITNIKFRRGKYI